MAKWWWDLEFYIRHLGSVAHLNFMNKTDKEIFQNGFRISMIRLVEMAAERQKYIDQTQSLNLFFLPNVEKNTFMKSTFLLEIKGEITLLCSFFKILENCLRRKKVICEEEVYGMSAIMHDWAFSSSLFHSESWFFDWWEDFYIIFIFSKFANLSLILPILNIPILPILMYARCLFQRTHAGYPRLCQLQTLKIFCIFSLERSWAKNTPGFMEFFLY